MKQQDQNTAVAPSASEPISHEPISHEPISHDRGVSAVSRAIGDLRRGVPVVLRNGQSILIVAAAENGYSAMAKLAATLDGDITCAVTATRAEVLGLKQDGVTPVLIKTNNPFSATDIDCIIDDTIAVGETPTLSGANANAFESSAVDLVRVARLLPAALLRTSDGAAEAIAAREDFLIVDVQDIDHYRAASENFLDALVEVDIPLAGAEIASMSAFRPADGGKPHLAIVVGKPDPSMPVLARLHSECFTGDLLGSLRCDCGDQLRGAIEAITQAGGGVLLYLAQEGRGIGLINKLRAYKLQDSGFDTIDANERLGFDADERVYTPAAAMLKKLGFNSIRLMTNNPTKVAALSAHGIVVTDRVPHAFPANGHNEHYLRTKADRGGHIL
ncbi:MAG: GTP cyclohydrolase II [Alphaproteobacteria bacterium]|nr:GTP cyclohydrolase II [Alphaproteobacteria bacterium]